MVSLRRRVGQLEAGLNAVQGLIDESGGVYGLHDNGDSSPWDELLAGGRFECWLIDFCKAQEGGGNG